MNTHKMTLALAVAAVLAAGAAPGGTPVPAGPSQPALRAKARLKPPSAPQVEAPAPPAVNDSDGPAASAAGLGATNPFAASPNGASANTAIAPPVTITYAGAATALAISDSGTGRGLSSALSNAANANSAIYASSSGTGPSIYGKNTGTASTAAYFAETDKKSSQAAAFATTNGSGAAILASTTNTDTNYPVIYGYNTVTADVGTGVEGQGGYVGVYGVSGGSGGSGVMGSGFYGVAGNSDSGDGIYGFSFTGDGVYGQSDNYVGVYGYSVAGDGMQAWTMNGSEALYAENETGGYGVNAYSSTGTAIHASSGSSYGVWADTTNTFALIGEDHGSGTGVYGSSVSGWAGEFAGPVVATSYSTSSDRNVKTNIAPVDTKAVLAAVSGLPISYWDFKRDLTRRHVGPMAQDFKAAFGLDGADDTHINLTDLAGISLAAIQALNMEMKEKDAEIAQLKAQFEAQSKEMTAQLAAQARAVAEMKLLAEVAAARMTVLERRHGGAAPAAAVRTAARAQPGVAD